MTAGGAQQVGSRNDPGALVHSHINHSLHVQDIVLGKPAQVAYGGETGVEAALCTV